MMSSQKVSDAASCPMRCGMSKHTHPSQCCACVTLDVNRSSVRRQPPLDNDADMRRRLRELAKESQRLGIQRLHVFLRCEGLVIKPQAAGASVTQGGPANALASVKKRSSVFRARYPHPAGQASNGTLILSATAGIRTAYPHPDYPWPLRTGHAGPRQQICRILGNMWLYMLMRLLLQVHLPRSLLAYNRLEFTWRPLNVWA